MSDPPTERIRQLFLEVARLAPAARSSYLDSVSGDDAGLRAELDRLLRHHDHPTGFVDTIAPAITGVVERPPAPEHLGNDRIGRYRLVRRIASGGMGTVYEAEQDYPRRTVALKVLHPYSASPESLRRFEYEAEILARLEHPGIARIYDAGSAESENGTQAYCAMELVHGVPITEYVTEHALDLRARLGLLASVADAVHYAGQRGIVHRDLKPANVLVGDDGEPRILDFGIARVVNTDVRRTTMQTEVGQLIGTVPYMSPEQTTGCSDAIDARSDIYALGVLMYEVLTGRLPFDFGDKMIHEAVRMIREEAPVRLGHVDRALTGDVETIVETAMERDPARRYQSASELAGDIRRWFDGAPITARPPSAVYHLSRLARRHRKTVAVAAAGFMLLVLGAIGTTWGWVHTASQRDEVAIANERLNDMVGFLAGILAPDKVAGGGTGVLLREALDAAAVQIDEEFTASPLSAALLHHTLGGAYQKLAAYDASEHHLESAWETRRSLLGPSHRDTLSTVSALASLDHECGRDKKSESMLRDARAIAIDEYGASDPTTVELTGVLSSILIEQRRPREARPLAEEVVAARTHLGPDDPLYLEAQFTLALCLAYQGDHAKGLEMFESVYARRQRVLGPTNLDTLNALQSVAMGLAKCNRFEEAEPRFRELLTLQHEVFPDDHPEVARTLHNFASVFYHREQYEDAERMERESMEILRAIHGDEHRYIATCRAWLARITDELDRPVEAEAEYREALRIQRALWGEDHPSYRKSLASLGSFYERRERWNDAERCFSQAVESGRRDESAEDGAPIRQLRELGDFYRRTERPEFAVTTIRKAMDEMGRPGISADERDDVRAAYQEALAALPPESAR